MVEPTNPTNIMFTDDGKIQETGPPPTTEQQINTEWPNQGQAVEKPEASAGPKIIFDEYGNIVDILDPALLKKVNEASKAKIIFDPKTGEILQIKDQVLMDKVLAASEARVLFDETGNILDVKDIGLLDEMQKAIGLPKPESLPNLRAAFDEQGEVRRILDREAMLQAAEWIYPPSYDGGPRYIHYPDGTTLQVIDFQNFDQVHDHSRVLREEVAYRGQHPEFAEIPLFVPLPPQPEVQQPFNPIYMQPQLPHGSHVTENLLYQVFGSLTIFLGVVAMWVMVYLNRNLVKQKIQEIRKKASLTQFTQNDRLLNADNYDEWPDISNNTAGSMFNRSSGGANSSSKKQEPDDGFSKQ